MGYETGYGITLEAGQPYTNPRTGRTYATKALADMLDPDPVDIRYSPLSGLPTNQTGNQKWMDATVDGKPLMPNITLQEKFDILGGNGVDNADAAFEWASRAVAERVATMNNGGQVAPVANPSAGMVKTTAESPAVTAAERSPVVAAVAAVIPSAEVVKKTITAPVVLMLAIGLIVAYLIIGAIKGSVSHA